MRPAATLLWWVIVSCGSVAPLAQPSDNAATKALRFFRALPTRNPDAVLRLLRPAPADADDRARALAVLPERGELRPDRYERAKLAVKGSQASSRDEAFKALNTAAEKAIHTGKANEMLDGLQEDKSGDFSKLSQKRNEWSTLVVALKRKDTSLLTE